MAWTLKSKVLNNDNQCKRETPVATIRQNFANNCVGDLLSDVRSLTDFCPAQNRRDKKSATGTNI